MKDLECPNCGGAQPTHLSGGMLQCQFCGQQFMSEQLRRQQQEDERRKQEYNLRLQQQQMVADTMNSARSIGKKVLLFVGIFLVIIFSFVGFMVYKSMSEANKMQEEIMQQFQQK